ncbi:hypothetical protein [Longimicrobium sp.]|uniref:hypothetical protein n=1 Tax=Longimicrobium sp. TaxID=2029185 RepID=UPI002C2E1893|nr:hypothetical protein [Longimicrobium sp.]HSU17141.1 hypothetical protein [Longimicrobium sp.]
MAAQQAMPAGGGVPGGTVALDRWATGRNALIALALVLVFVGLFIAARRLLGLKGAPSIGAPWPLASPGELVDIAKRLGTDGRRGTVIVTLVLDTLFPLVYGAALAFSSGYLLARLNAPAPLRALRFIPLAAVVFDYLENLCIALLLGFYPRMNAAAGPLAVFTRGKWLLIFASTAVVLIAGAWLLARKVFGRG